MKHKENSNKTNTINDFDENVNILSTVSEDQQTINKNISFLEDKITSNLSLLLGRAIFGTRYVSKKDLKESEEQTKEWLEQARNERKSFDKSNDSFLKKQASSSRGTELDNLIGWISSFIIRIDKVRNSNMNDDYNSMEAYTSRWHGIEYDIHDSRYKINFGQLSNALGDKMSEWEIYKFGDEQGELPFREWLFAGKNQTLDNWHKILWHIFSQNNAKEEYKKHLKSIGRMDLIYNEWREEKERKYKKTYKYKRKLKKELKKLEKQKKSSNGHIKTKIKPKDLIEQAEQSCIIQVFIPANPNNPIILKMLGPFAWYSLGKFYGEAEKIQAIKSGKAKSKELGIPFAIRNEGEEKIKPNTIKEHAQQILKQAPYSCTIVFIYTNRFIGRLKLKSKFGIINLEEEEYDRYKLNNAKKISEGLGLPMEIDATAIS